MSTLPLHESFRNPVLDPRLVWRCEPAQWSVQADSGGLRIQPDADTDYWQRTHYGFKVDNGHFLFADVDSSFVMTTHVSFRPAHQYDQAGLMVRLSADCWLKTSVEYEPGTTNRLGVVVTNAGYSDWSTQEVPSSLLDVWLRVARAGSDYHVEWSVGGSDWTQLRLGHLVEDDGARSVAAGIYACSPKAAGYLAEFEFLDITSSR
jgi:uncharacterized protein